MSIPVERLKALLEMVGAKRSATMADPDFDDYEDGYCAGIFFVVQELQKVVNESETHHTGNSPEREPHVRESGDAIQGQGGKASNAAH